MNKKKIIWAVISLIIALLSIWAVVSQSKSFSLEMLVEFVRSSNKFWLVMAFVSMFGFIWFEGYAVLRIARCLGFSPTLMEGTVYGAADVYFSAITPSASGGQPASAYFMLRDGMSGPAVTITLLLNLIMYSLALLALGAVSVAAGWHMFMSFSLLSKILIGTGMIVIVGLSVVFYLLLCRAKILYGICNRALKFLERVHLLRHGKEKRRKLNKTMKNYSECAIIITRNKKALFEAFLLNVLQRLSQLGVSFMVFMALGKGAKQALSAMLMQCFVALGSNTVPIPGSMGVADYIMLDGFDHLVGPAESATMEILCRGITFYGCVLVGGLIVIIGYFTRRMRKREC